MSRDVFNCLYPAVSRRSTFEVLGPLGIDRQISIFHHKSAFVTANGVSDGGAGPDRLPHAFRRLATDH